MYITSFTFIYYLISLAKHIELFLEKLVYNKEGLIKDFNNLNTLWNSFLYPYANPIKYQLSSFITNTFEA